MRKTCLALVAAVFLLAPPVQAQDATVLRALDQIPADPAWWRGTRVVDFVDLAAMKRAAGVGDEVSLVDFTERRLSPEAELTVTSLLWRLHGAVEFRNHLLVGASTWRDQLGVDFLAIDWFSEPGTPPDRLLLLGGTALPSGVDLEILGAGGFAPVERNGITAWMKGEKDNAIDWFSEPGTPPDRLLLLGGTALPSGEDLEILGAGGFAPVERNGITAWMKGEKDNGLDLKNREPGFPFWGWLGSAVRLYRSEEALVGARNWPTIDLAVAVERGEAESLADLAPFRLAAEAAAHPDYSQGPILQMTFVDETLGEGVIANAPRADGLPPFELFAFADREDASGQQVILVLTYGTDAETAAVTADRVAETIAAYRDSGGRTLAERFPGFSLEPTLLETENGAAAVVRLATPPEPVETEDGKVNNRSRLYAQILRMLYSRDLGFLAPRG